jgi:hypothetical protein
LALFLEPLFIVMPEVRAFLSTRFGFNRLAHAYKASQTEKRCNTSSYWKFLDALAQTFGSSGADKP